MAGKFYYYSIRRVKKRGKKDGRDWRWKFFPFSKEQKEPDPPLNQGEPSEFEKELLEAAEQNLSREAQRWAKLDEKLHKDCRDAEDRYNEAKKTLEKERKEHADSVVVYEKAQERFLNQPTPHLPKAWYWFILLVLITPGEFIFNALVFNVLGQSRLDTRLMAVVIAVIIPVFSHFIGNNLRREKKSKTTIGLMIASGLGTLVVLLGITILREKYFEASRILEVLGIEWNVTMIAIMFLTINIGLFLVVVILAYEAGYKNPEEYQHIKRIYKEAEKRLKSEASELGEAAKRFTAAKKRFNAVHSKREHTFEEIKHRAEEERDIWVGLIQIYRAANMEARRQKEKPKSFAADPEKGILIPQSLQRLECNGCSYREMREEVKR